jgi:hypothetical protein
MVITPDIPDPSKSILVDAATKSPIDNIVRDV